MLDVSVKPMSPVLDYGGHWCKGHPKMLGSPLDLSSIPLKKEHVERDRKQVGTVGLPHQQTLSL